MTPIQYCENKKAHSTCSAVINNKGVMTIFYEGIKYSNEEFNAKYPINHKKIEAVNNKFLKGENPDGTKKWLVD